MEAITLLFDTSYDKDINFYTINHVYKSAYGCCSKINYCVVS